MRSYVAISGPGFEATEANIKTAHAAGYLLGRLDICAHRGLNGVMRAAAAGCEEAVGAVSVSCRGQIGWSAQNTHTILIPTGMGEMHYTACTRGHSGGCHRWGLGYAQ